MATSRRAGPLRVVQILTSIDVGGLERFVLALQTGLDPTQVRTTAVSLTGRDPWAGIFRDSGIHLRQFGAPNRLRGPMSVVRLVIEWCRLVAHLRREKPDIVQVHDFFPALFGRTAAWAAGVPHTISTLHNLYDWYPRWTFRLDGLLARRTDAIVAVSDSVCAFAQGKGHLPPAKLHTIRNGADENRFRPLPDQRHAVRAELGLAESDILIGSIGSVTIRKAHWILARAVAPLMRENPRIQVGIWGANHANPQHAEGSLRVLLAELGIADRFTLHPPRPDVERLHAAFDLHCMPSVTEGLSLASVEAMMCGSVNVFSDIGPFREVVDDGVTGFLFRSGDPADLELVLRSTFRRFQELESLRTTARAIAVERFGLQRMIREWQNLFLQISARQQTHD